MLPGFASLIAALMLVGAAHAQSSPTPAAQWGDDAHGQAAVTRSEQSGAAAPAPEGGSTAAAGPAISPADSVLLEQQTRQLASELRCPVCQGLSIEDSPTELAVQMKDVIRDQLRAGRTPDEVRAYYIERYGEWILLEPARAGFNWVVYLLPVAVLLGGGVFMLALVRRWTRDEPSDPAAP